MKDISQEDKQLALRISGALQRFFNENPGTHFLRSTDAYDILVTKGLVERDRHQGIKFRDFLKRLKDANALSFIPQCSAEPRKGGQTNWFFKSVSTNVGLPSKPTVQQKSEANEEYTKLEAIIDTLPKRPETDFDFIAKKTRATYPRAYEYWSPAEEALLLDTAKRVGSPLELSKIFRRQPSALERKLSELQASKSQ